MSHLDVHQFICRDDNYGVLVHDTVTGTTISIDAPHAGAIADNLKKRGWQLTHILTTHHHIDHVEGNLELKDAYGCKIIGPDAEKDRIPGIDQTVKGGDVITLPSASSGSMIALAIPSGRSPIISKMTTCCSPPTTFSPWAVGVCLRAHLSRCTIQ